MQLARDARPLLDALFYACVEFPLHPPDAKW
jgi:hypothetical protein